MGIGSGVKGRSGSGLSVRARLVLGIGGAVLIAVAATIAGVLQMQRASNTLRAADDLAVFADKAAGYADRMKLQRSLQAEYVASPDPAIPAEFEQSATEAFALADELVARFPDDEIVVDAVAAARTLDEQHDPLVFDQLFPAVDAGDTATVAELAPQATALVTQFVVQATTVQEHVHALAVAKREDAISALATARLLQIVLGVISALVALVALLLVIRALGRALEGIKRVANDAAAGNLTTRWRNSGMVELDDVGQGLNRMVEALAAVVAQIRATSGSLLDASRDMSNSSTQAGRAIGEIARAVTDVAMGAERQVKMVDAVRSSADQMAQAVQLSATSAQETAEAADEARAVAEEGVQAASQASSAMTEVRESTLAVTEAIRHLGEKSTEIGGIVETITGIAGQTNLLALNAAIEAARAGEHGKGFAVVAEEVRKLAEESQRAAGSIAGLIEQIQHETQRVVEIVEDGARKSEDGAAIVEHAREAFLRIGTSVEDMSARVSAIAAAAADVADGADRVRADVSEVAVVAEQSSASSEEVSASTEETTATTEEFAAAAAGLARTAEQLDQLVGRFNV
ncbi:MAG: HAMP domain-containing methyl-accepting chemotaxis protein [Thermoleophilia bacterium]